MRFFLIGRNQLKHFSIFTATLFFVFALIGATSQPIRANSESPLNSSSSTPITSQTARVLDFDGDGKSDYAVVRDVIGGLVWYIKLSSGGFIATQFGLNNDWLVPEDYDGDGKWDIAVWRQGDFYNPQGYFYILRSQSGTVQVIPWGSWLDTPEKTQDFDGDNKADPTVVRFNQGGNLVWYTLLSQSGTVRVESFGLTSSDGPIRGDFDGDNKADLAVRRCSGVANYFWYKRSSDNQIRAEQFGHCGDPGDVTVSGNFDGDNKTDLAVYRWSTATWYWKQSSDGSNRAVQFGIPNSDLPAPADYDGDGKTDPTVLHETGFGNPSYFHVLGSTNGYFVYQWGTYGDHDVAFELMTH
jgi:hypothetical protein